MRSPEWQAVCIQDTKHEQQIHHVFNVVPNAQNEYSAHPECNLCTPAEAACKKEWRKSKDILDNASICEQIK